MNNITYAVSVDVNNPIIPYNVYVASVLDSNVRYLEITLYENGNIITLSNTANATASLVADNVLVNDNVNCTIQDNIITVPLEDLQRHGNLDVQVTVTEGTKVLAIPFPIQVRVTPNIAENAQVDENSLGSYAEVVHEIAEARGAHTTLHDAITAKLDDADGSVKENNIADESITVEKVADDLAAVINAKEEKSNKKTTLTGNESSNDFYPTTKAVADALNTKAPASEVGDLKSVFESLLEYEGSWSDDIFDADDVAADVAIDSNPAGKVLSYQNAKSLIFPLEKNVKYKIVKNIGNQFRVAVYQGKPEIGDMPLESLVTNDEVSEIEYSCNGNDIYLIVYGESRGSSFSFSCYIYKKELILKNSIMPDVVVDVSNNIFSSDMIVEHLALDNSRSKPGWSIVDSSSSSCSVVVPMTYGKTYTVTRGTGDRFRAGVFDHVPEVSNVAPVELLVLNGEATTCTYECQNDGYYMVVYGNSSGSSFTMSVTEKYKQVNHDYLVTLSHAEEKAIQDVNTLSIITGNIYSENMYVLNAIMDFSGNSAFYRQNSNTATIVFPLRNGAEYTVNRLNAPRFRVSVFDHKPVSSSPNDKDYPVTVLNMSSDAITSVYYRCVNDGYYMAIYGSISNQNLAAVEILETANLIEKRYLPRYETRDFEQSETYNQFVDETRDFEQKINTSSVYAHIVPAVANSSAVTRFIAEMNKKAAEIGMTNTIYADVAGYETAVNRTTARDMVKLGISALSYPELCRAWGKMEYIVTTYNDTPRTITAEYSETNYSTLTAAYKVLGRKTGYMGITGGGFTCTMLAVCVVNGKAVIGYCAGMVDRAHRPLAMKELMDIVKDIMDNGSTSITPQNFTSACAAILPEGMPASWEQQTIETIYELNADEQIVPASTAKVMTAIVMLENLGSMHDKMTVLSTDGLSYGSGRVLQDGDIIDYKQALYLIMLLSSGPCCRVVARTLGTVMLNAYDV